MARKMLMAEVSGSGIRSRQRLGWMDDVNVALGSRWMAVEAAPQLEGVETPGTYADG